MKDRGLTKNWIEALVNFNRWNKMIDDGILEIVSHSTNGRICKVADFVHE